MTMTNDTGLAHLMEHMAFKGTRRVGGTNWKQEGPLLDAQDEGEDVWGRQAFVRCPVPKAATSIACVSVSIVLLTHTLAVTPRTFTCVCHTVFYALRDASAQLKETGSAAAASKVKQLEGQLAQLQVRIYTLVSCLMFIVERDARPGQHLFCPFHYNSSAH